MRRSKLWGNLSGLNWCQYCAGVCLWYGCGINSRLQSVCLGFIFTRGRDKLPINIEIFYHLSLWWIALISVVHVGYAGRGPHPYFCAFAPSVRQIPAVYYSATGPPSCPGASDSLPPPPSESRYQTNCGIFYGTLNLLWPFLLSVFPNNSFCAIFRQHLCSSLIYCGIIDNVLYFLLLTDTWPGIYIHLYLWLNHILLFFFWCFLNIFFSLLLCTLIHHIIWFAKNSFCGIKVSSDSE